MTFRYANGVNVYHTGRMGEWALVFYGTEGKIAVNRGKLKTWPESIMHKPTAPDEVNLYRSPAHGASRGDCREATGRVVGSACTEEDHVWTWD